MFLCPAARRYGTCEIDWAQARFSVAYRLYVILIFLFNFFLPVSVIVFTYVSIMRTVSASHKSSRGGEVSERQRKIETAITQVTPSTPRRCPVRFFLELSE